MIILENYDNYLAITRNFIRLSQNFLPSCQIRLVLRTSQGPVPDFETPGLSRSTPSAAEKNAFDSQFSALPEEGREHFPNFPFRPPGPC
jgi:hypothetical protein